MPSTSSPFFRFPGEVARELWLREGDGAWRRAAADNGAKGGLYVVDALALDSAPFWALATTDGPTDLEAIAALHWEGLGLEADEDGQSWIHWRVAEEGGRVLIGTMALVQGAALPKATELLPERFEPSARLLPIPSGECALWKELGRHVMAFTRGGELLHVAVLNARALDAEAAHEIRDVVLALELRGLLAPLKGCRVWTEAGEEFTDELGKMLGVKVRTEARPSLQMPRQESGLLPPEVARSREEKLSRGQNLRLVLTAVLGCFAFLAAWGGWLAYREHRVEKAFAALRSHESEVEAVRQAQMRWDALQAATDPDGYPVEVFHQIVELLPDEGIQLKEFTFDSGKLVLKGLASTWNHALKFKADVENDPELQRFTWNFPQPQILEDNRANFEAFATLNIAVPSPETHESE
jgi:hypothetical protein